MGALLMLALAADPAPPPAMEAPVQAQEPLAAVEPPPAEEPAWDLGAQVSITAFQSLNGTFLGIAACGAINCYNDAAMPIVFGVLGAGTGFALSLVDREPARGWGRAAFLSSTIVGAGVLSVLVAMQALSLGQQLGYSLIFLADAAFTAGALIAVRRFSPRPETVLLADTLGLWGVVVGAAASTLARSDPGNFMFAGALGGVALGAVLGGSAERMTPWRVLIANAAALLGALVLGGGLTIYETWAATPRRPYDPMVPAAGVAAGVAGGFLAGFALSESF
jgi:hypothetical protein